MTCRYERDQKANDKKEEEKVSSSAFDKCTLADNLFMCLSNSLLLLYVCVCVSERDREREKRVPRIIYLI